VTDILRPLTSLTTGQWFKLICGASYQHLPEIRNLALVFTLAGADCIDVAADPAVVHAAQTGIKAALQQDATLQPPILMVSLNDGEDPHFRKATLNPAQCPSDCPQPCVSICPAEAIRFDLQGATTDRHASSQTGVIAERCYGCGRCLPVCPIQQISTQTHSASPDTIGPFITAGVVNAIEIHTQIGRLSDFARVWQALAGYKHHLKVLAVSCGDGEHLIDYLWSLYKLLQPLPCALVWQTDGRPMSGDIGNGATRASLKLGQKVLAANLPGYVQLAGGTNDHTVSKLRSLGLLRPLNTPNLSSLPTPTDATTRYITGVAYGSFARSLLAPIHAALANQLDHHLENHADLLAQALNLAQTLMQPLKQAHR
jgi:Fe-S-cluster-containing hydrogenase component 2